MIAALFLAALLQSGDTVRVPRIDSIPGVDDSLTVGRPKVKDTETPGKPVSGAPKDKKPVANTSAPATATGLAGGH